MRRRRWVALGLIVLSGLGLLLGWIWFGGSTVLTGHTAAVTGVAFAPDGQTLASASLDDTIRLWRRADHTLLRTIPASMGGLNSIAFTPDSQMVAAGGVDGTARLWLVSDGTPVRAFSGATSQVQGVAISPDGRLLAAASWDGNVYLWRAADSILVRTIAINRGQLKSVAFAPDGRILAIGGINGWTWLRTVADGGEATRLRDPQRGGNDPPANSLAFSPDGQWIASASPGYVGTTALWQMADGAEVVELHGTKDLLRVLSGHGSAMDAVAFAPDGQTLATHWDEQIWLWHLFDNRPFEVFTGHRADVTSLAFAPDGRTLASGSQDTTVRLWYTSPLPSPIPTP